MTYIENASVCSSDTNVNKSISKVEPDRCSMGWRQRGAVKRMQAVSGGGLWKQLEERKGPKLKKDSNKISCKTGGWIEKSLLTPIEVSITYCCAAAGSVDSGTLCKLRKLGLCSCADTHATRITTLLSMTCISRFERTENLFQFYLFFKKMMMFIPLLCSSLGNAWGYRNEPVGTNVAALSRPANVAIIYSTGM